MRECTVCHIEKPDSEFQTYYHSSFGKHYTRRQCTECFYSLRNRDFTTRELEAIAKSYESVTTERYDSDPNSYVDETHC